MTHRPTVDVSALPGHAFGNRGLIWWGTAGYMVIEGSIFVIALIVYFYLRLKVSAWPPSLPNPDVGLATINLLLVLVSVVPAHLAKVAAERFDRRTTVRWLFVLTAIGVITLVIRAFEYADLNCRWDDNAYASVTWILLSLHTIHVGTDVVESGVLLALAARGPITERRFVDLSENSLYWYFIVAWWVPIYLTVFWAPRWL